VQGIGETPQQAEKPNGRLLLSVAEVASALSVSTRTVWRLAKAGHLPQPVQIGRSARWRAAWVEQFVAGLEPGAVMEVNHD